MTPSATSCARAFLRGPITESHSGTLTAATPSCPAMQHPDGLAVDDDRLSGEQPRSAPSSRKSLSGKRTLTQRPPSRTARAEAGPETLRGQPCDRGYARRHRHDRALRRNQYPVARPMRVVRSAASARWTNGPHRTAPNRRSTPARIRALRQARPARRSRVREAVRRRVRQSPPRRSSTSSAQHRRTAGSTAASTIHSRNESADRLVVMDDFRSANHSAVLHNTQKQERPECAGQEADATG